MTPVAAITTATVRIPGSLRPPTVYRRDLFPRLVDDLSAGLGLYLVYAQDITSPHPPGWYPENVLAVSVSGDDEGWGAAYLRDQESQWIARNPRPAAEAPALLFDAKRAPTFRLMPCSRSTRSVLPSWSTCEQASGREACSGTCRTA